MPIRIAIGGKQQLHDVLKIVDPSLEIIDLVLLIRRCWSREELGR